MQFPALAGHRREDILTEMMSTNHVTKLTDRMYALHDTRDVHERHPEL